MELPTVHLDSKEKALRDARVHPEVERAVPERERSLFFTQAARIGQRIPKIHLGLITEARIPGFRKYVAQALFRNIFCRRAPTISPLNPRVPLKGFTVGVVEDVENGDYVRLNDGARIVHLDVIEQGSHISTEPDTAMRGHHNEAVFGARHDHIRQGIRVVEVLRGRPVVGIEDCGQDDRSRTAPLKFVRGLRQPSGMSPFTKVATNLLTQVRGLRPKRRDDT